MGDLVPFPARPAPRSFLDDRELAILELSRELCDLDAQVNLAVGWLRSARRARRWSIARLAVRSIRRAREDIAVLERARLRLAGPELALLKGGT